MRTLEGIDTLLYKGVSLQRKFMLEDMRTLEGIDTTDVIKLCISLKRLEDMRTLEGIDTNI